MWLHWLRVSLKVGVGSGTVRIEENITRTDPLKKTDPDPADQKFPRSGSSAQRGSKMASKRSKSDPEADPSRESYKSGSGRADIS